MLYTELTAAAMRLAYNAHHGQTDKTGVPYIFHPYHLAEILSDQGEDEYTVCAALLHDVAEDTSVSLSELERLFQPEVTETVRLLTHDKDTDYFDYVKALCSDVRARAVKLADLKHNSDPERLAVCDISGEKRRELSEKYKKAFEILLAGDNAPEP